MVAKSISVVLVAGDVLGILVIVERCCRMIGVGGHSFQQAEETLVILSESR